MQREQHLLLRSMDECSVVAMVYTPDRDLLLIQIPVAKMKRSMSINCKSRNSTCHGVAILSDLQGV